MVSLSTPRSQALFILFAAIAILAWYLSAQLMVIFGGTLLAVLLSSLAMGIQKRTFLSYHVSLATVFLIFLGLFLLFAAVVAPSFLEQGREFSDQVPSIISRGKVFISEMGLSVDMLTSEKALQSAGGLFGFASDAIGMLMNSFTQFTFILLLGFFFALSPHAYKSILLHVSPKKHHKKVTKLWNRLGNQLWLWLIARFIAMLAVGVLTVVCLWILGIPLAVFLGVLAGVLNFIPTFGPLLGVIPALLVGSSEGLMYLIYIPLLFFCIQMVENNVITPFVQQKMLSMPAAMVIIAQLVFGALLGPLGVVFAVPLGVALSILVDEIFVQK